MAEKYEEFRRPEDGGMTVDGVDGQETTTTQEQISIFKKQRLQSIILIGIALVALVFSCSAWFINNTNTTADGVQLASEGIRFDIGLLQGGSVGVYDQDFANVFDLKESTTETTVNGTTYKLAEFGSTSELLVSSDSSMDNINRDDALSPGDSGQLTIYLIPRVDNLKSVQVNISLSPYVMLNESGSSETINPTPLDLTTEPGRYLLGHLLFFTEKDANGQYDGWVDKGNAVFTPKNFPGGTGTSADNDFFQKDTVYTITLYWVWPRELSNIVRPGDGSLFDNADNQAYTSIIQSLNNTTNGTDGSDISRYNFVRITGTDQYAENPFSSTMSNRVFNYYNSAYNSADQLIGTRIRYIKTTLLVTEPEN